MFLRKKAQSTAEYAITIGIVVAVVAGVMSVALKGGMRQKATQATDILKSSGTASAGLDTSITGVMGVTTGGGVLNATVDGMAPVYEGDARHTTVQTQESESILKKGGALSSSSNSVSNTSSVNYESYNAVHQ